MRLGRLVLVWVWVRGRGKGRVRGRGRVWFVRVRVWCVRVRVGGLVRPRVKAEELVDLLVG